MQRSCWLSWLTYHSVICISLANIDSARDFTIMMRAQSTAVKNWNEAHRKGRFLSLVNKPDNERLAFLLHDGSLEVMIKTPSGFVYLRQKDGQKVGPDYIPLWVAFTQDQIAGKWILYVNGLKVDEKPMIDGFDWGQVSFPIALR